MLGGYILLTRADENNDRAFDAPVEYVEGPKILVNLSVALTCEPVIPSDETSPTTIAFDTSEVVVMETREFIGQAITARRIEEARANALR